MQVIERNMNGTLEQTQATKSHVLYLDETTQTIQLAEITKKNIHKILIGDHLYTALFCGGDNAIAMYKNKILELVLQNAANDDNTGELAKVSGL